MEVVVFGAGSLGSLIGGLLATQHEVTLVARSPHVDAILDRGLRLVGQVDRVVHPEAVSEIGTIRADLAVVTVKAYDTAAAAEALSRCDLDAVLSLQNGMGNEEVLAERMACLVLAGTTSYGARNREPGVVECTGVGEVTIGPRPSVDHDRDSETEFEIAHDVTRAFQESGIDCVVEADMRSTLWQKLAVNAAINPMTALAGVENGMVLDGPAQSIAERAAIEVAEVARSEGVALSDETVRDELYRVASNTAENRSSMFQDVSASRRTEIDAISGYVIDRAIEPVPVNESLAALVRTWESARGLR